MNTVPQDEKIVDQYKTSKNLDARIQLHALFSTNPQPWHHWVFERFDLAPDARVLELGGGPGTLWLKNMERIPEGWQITLSDFSEGMRSKARENLAAATQHFAFEVIDAQAIPFPDASFDAVIANHMLYHVPDRDQALAEIARVLTPTGVLYASTVGERHMLEMWSLLEPFVPDIFERLLGVSQGFTMENGAAQLQSVFSDVELLPYVDGLHITAVEPVLAYIASANTMSGLSLSESQIVALRASLESHMLAEGAFQVTKASGLFVARK